MDLCIGGEGGTCPVTVKPYFLVFHRSRLPKHIRTPGADDDTRSRANTRKSNTQNRYAVFRNRLCIETISTALSHTCTSKASPRLTTALPRNGSSASIIRTGSKEHNVDRALQNIGSDLWRGPDSHRFALGQRLLWTRMLRIFGVVKTHTITPESLSGRQGRYNGVPRACSTSKCRPSGASRFLRKPALEQRPLRNVSEDSGR
jgi:hypothetical protein